MASDVNARVPPTRSRLRAVWAGGCAAAGLAYVWHYLSGVDAAYFDRLSSGAPGWLIAAVTLQALQLGISNRVWVVVVRQFSGIHLSWLDGFAHMALVNLGRYLPGKLWGVAAKLAALAERGVTPPQGLAAAMTEQLALVQGNVVLGLLLLPLVLPTQLWFAAAAWSAAVGSVIGAPWLLARGHTIAQRWPKYARHFGAALAVDASYRLATISLLAAWLCNGLVLFALQLAIFGGAITTQGLALALFANACGAMAGALALFAPGGIGVRESVATGVLATVLPAGDALFLMVVMRLWMVLADGLLALLLLARAGRG